MTGLDDLDNAASEEDDSCLGKCQACISAASNPLFSLPCRLSTVPGEETVSDDPPFIPRAPAPRLPVSSPNVSLSLVKLLTPFRVSAGKMRRRITDRFRTESKRRLVHFCDVGRHASSRKKSKSSDLAGKNLPGV